MSKRWSLPAVLLLLGCLPAYGQQDIEVRATINEATIGIEGQLVFKLELEGTDISNINTSGAPEADGLVVVRSNPSVSRSTTITNGAVRQSVTLQWIYRPLRQGRVRIGAARVTIGGKAYATEPIDITVVSQAQRSKRPVPNTQGRGFGAPFWSQTDPTPPEEDQIGPEDLFIRAVPSKTSARQNEQITIEYRLYFRRELQLRHSRLAGPWDAEGFWREEFTIDTRPVPRTVVENGIAYHTILLKRVAVFPTRPGTLTIDPLRIESEVYHPIASSDPFRGFFSLRNPFQPVDLASPPLRIRTDPLPEQAPDVFSGAVGSYTLHATLDKANVEVGEPLQVTISIRGTGNIATLDAPLFEPPGIFETYEPRVESTIHRDGSRITGDKTFGHVIIPRSNGSFDMPPVTFAWYDPDRERYVTAEADLPTVHVSGTATPLGAGTTAEGLPVDDIAGIMTSSGGWHALDAPPLHQRAWPYAALILPMGALWGLYANRKRADRLAHDVRYARSRIAHPLARKHLKRAGALLTAGQAGAFYEEIERALNGFIGNRMNIAETGLTREQLDACVQAIGVGTEQRRLLREILDECDQARFAPVLPDRAAMESARERAARLIIAVDEAMNGRPAESIPHQA